MSLLQNAGRHYYDYLTCVEYGHSKSVLSYVELNMTNNSKNKIPSFVSVSTHADVYPVSRLQ